MAEAGADSQAVAAEEEASVVSAAEALAAEVPAEAGNWHRAQSTGHHPSLKLRMAKQGKGHRAMRRECNI